MSVHISPNYLFTQFFGVGPSPSVTLRRPTSHSAVFSTDSAPSSSVPHLLSIVSSPPTTTTRFTCTYCPAFTRDGFLHLMTFPPRFLHARQIPIYSILELSILPPGPLSLVGQSIISGGLHFSQGFTMVLLIGPNGRIREELKKSDVVQWDKQHI